MPRLKCWVSSTMRCQDMSSMLEWSALTRAKAVNTFLSPPGYEGEIPEGYFVAKPKTYESWVALRASVKDGDTATPVAMIKKHMNIYPLSQADNPPAETFHNISGKQINTIHSTSFKFYEEINEVIQKEPADAFPPELVGTFASIGIKKGQPFEPDARMKGILTEAAAIGNAACRSLVFATRDKNAFYFEDRQWKTGFIGGSHEFMNEGELMLDALSMFHTVGGGRTPAMVTPKPGTGSIYAFSSRDAKGQYLDGSNTYKLTMPAPVPTKDFWSFMAYSGQHRSYLETDQKAAGIDSKSPDIKANEDGSYTLWFSPEAPEGKESNWVQTRAGKSFFAMLRLYGPEEPWFEKTWKPGDLELVK